MRSHTAQFSEKERTLQYRLSCVWGFIENTFGILAARWMTYYSPIITSIENAESYILVTIFLVYTPEMHCIHQHILLTYRLLVVKYERLSGVELFMMLLVWASYQMFVGHFTQIMLFLCVKHWRITLVVKPGAVSGNEIMHGGCKKQWNLRQDIYVLCYAILRSLVSLENLKNTWRGELILVKLQAISMLQRQPEFTVSKSTIKELEEGVKHAQSWKQR